MQSIKVFGNPASPYTQKLIAYLRYKNIKYNVTWGDVKTNLELPATLTTFLSGHIVQGHVDNTSVVTNIVENDNNLWTYHFKNTDTRFIVDKGSITINGISLTVVNPNKDEFSVAVINETYQRTNLKYLKIGSIVNIEYDILAKYMERMINDK